MTTLILVGHPATNPLDIARDVAARRDLVTVIDLAPLSAMLLEARGVDTDTARIMAIDLACGMATRLDAIGLHSIVVDARQPGETGAWRTRLLLVDTFTIVALLAEEERQVRRDMGRGPVDLLRPGHLSQLAQADPQCPNTQHGHTRGLRRHHRHHQAGTTRRDSRAAGRPDLSRAHSRHAKVGHVPLQGDGERATGTPAPPAGRWRHRAVHAMSR